MAAAFIVSTDEEVLPPGVMVLGLKLQVNPAAGAQESVIWLLKPPTAADPMFSVVDPPAPTVTVGAERSREKSVPAVAAGTNEPKSPLVWLEPPAVK